MSIQDIAYFLAALLFVLSLMGGLALILKKLGVAGPVIVTPSKRRLKVLENLAIDSRRRVVLIQRDNTEHLILLGHNNDVVIEQNIDGSTIDYTDSHDKTERAA